MNEICPTNKIDSNDSEEEWDSEIKNNESIYFNNKILKEKNKEENSDDENIQNLNENISLKNSHNNSKENLENFNIIKE